MKNSGKKFYIIFSSNVTDSQPQTEHLPNLIMPHDHRSKTFTKAIKNKMIELSIQNTRALIRLL